MTLTPITGQDSSYLAELLLSKGYWDFQPAMLRLQELEEPWGRHAHLIDGNSIRGPIQLDERWKFELSRRERLLFALTASPLNWYLHKVKVAKRRQR